ncbi:MAG: hypothetical protein RL308_1729 [Bacteroidota bacterium]|jgi:type I restriction enzyme S subunit
MNKQKNALNEIKLRGWEMSRKMTLMNDLIEEISMGPFGSDIKVDSFVSEGVPVLNGSNISGVSLTDKFTNFVTIQKATALKKANAKRGDIVITHRGTLGQIAYIPENSKYDRYIISQSQFKVRLKKDLVNPIYFTYYFHTEEGQRRLLSFKNHVGVPALAQATTNFRLLEFPFIPFESQTQIAKVLSDLDAKIELNNKINAELEAMAKLIYDYWFVQFEFPVCNEDGTLSAAEGYKSSGGKMVWNEELKRVVPEGWEVNELGNCINVFDSIRVPLSRTEREKIEGDIPYYGATSIMGYVNDFLFNDDYILLAEDGSVMDEKGRPIVQFIWGKSWVNNHAHVIQAKNKFNNEFIYQLVKMIPVVLIKTGSIQMKINQENLKKYKVLIPSLDLIEQYSNKANSIRKQLIINIEQNQKLAELRDWLLPMLMNGQVKVK